jgi:hypothetical protein
MKLRAVWGLTLSILLVTGLAVSATEVATVGAVTGNVTVDPGGNALAVGDEMSQGDTITLGAGDQITVTFADGATMEVSGPASFRLTELYDTARTIDLMYGTVNRLVANDIVMGIRTPLDSFVAARNSTVFVGISETPERTSVTYMLIEGEDAKVVDAGVVKVLTQGTPIEVEMVMVEETEPVEPPPPGSSDTAELSVGGHQLFVSPKDGFTVEELPGGGIRLTRIGEGVGMVVVDGETAFYLFPGEYVQFDAAGNASGHTGIVHIYAPLNRQGIYDEPISSPASASFTGTKVK